MSPSPSGGLLGDALGFLGAGRAANALSQGAIAAEHGVLGATQGAQQGVIDQLGRNSTDVINAQNQAIGNVSQYGNYANNALGGYLGQSQANTNPYIQNGQYGNSALAQYAAGQPQFTMAAGSGPGGAAGQFNFAPTMDQLAATPGYQFALQQGLQANQNANSASGLGASSNQNLDAAKFATGLASQTYQNAFQNAAQQFGLNQNAYNQTFNNAQNQFLTNSGLTLNTLGMLQNAGLTGTGQANQALLGLGGQAAQNIYNTGLYGGNAIQNAAQLNAQQGLQGMEYSGTAGMQGANIAGNYALDAAGANAQGIMQQYNNLGALGSGALNLAGGLIGL